LKAQNPKEYDLNHYLNAQQLAYWPEKWLSNEVVHVPHFFEDVQAALEMDPSNPMNPNESRKGTEIDKTININYLKRVHTFSAFVDMQDGKDPISISRALPARLRHSANSTTHADIVGKVKTTSGELYKKIQKWSLLLAM
jgi:hypothetical protein